ncbi:MAG: ribonuclease HII [Lachnospiraceae bacterium]|nr:ribonuclease HII [Lachnospiraceae bacterium]
MKAADEKKKIRLEKEIERTRGMLVYEERFQEKGLIGGIDEVGRGPLAGPVVAACVILPSDHPVLYLNDSKKLTERKRDELYDVLMEECVSWSVGMESWEVIDEINILQATYSAMRKAIASMDPAPDFLLNDAVTIPQVSIPQCPIVKGDSKSCSIAAASIIAKVTRDRLMQDYDRLYPGYGFARTKGYGTREHIEALKKLGPCPIHRRSFIGHFVENR